MACANRCCRQTGWPSSSACAIALAAYPSFISSQLTQSLQVLGISSAFVAMWLGIGLILFCIFTIEKLAAFDRNALVFGIAVGAAMAVAMLMLRWAYDQDLIEIDPFIPIVPALIIGFLTGTPIAGVLALAGVLYFVITGEAPITTLSVGSLFLAGLLPAAILALVLTAAVIVRSHPRGYVKGPPFRIGRALRSTPPAVPAFLVPVIVVGGSRRGEGSDHPAVHAG